MEIAKVTSKGQITLPKSIRNSLNLETGDKVVFIEENGAYILVNSDSLALKEKQFKPNVEGVIASLAFEDLIVSAESIEYAKQRINNKVSYEQQINNLKQKYSARAR